MTKMICPKCMGSDISLVGNTHYICNNPECTNGAARTQFRFVPDDEVKFPYNEIFVSRSTQDFFRKPYIELSATGTEAV